eukprot:comp22156_c0_seq1/m.32476 comp22156_c0_seq1/g.32476  ORF comp22156_c0_seq1/g.32476 comp22156_c0_seq1/m.32476 type:complete len:235 (-) comp22156_c0_seq1:253-957(-)
MGAQADDVSWEEGPSTPSTGKVNSTGLYILGAVGCGAAVLVAGVWPFLAPAFRRQCLPYVSATERQINMVLKMKSNKGALVDLGSGDGRIVLAAAKQGTPSVGYELNQWLVLYSKYRAWRMGVSHLAKFQRRDLWKVDLKPFSTIVVFGVQEMMPDLEQKFTRDMRDDAEVLAGRFPLATWEPYKEVVDPKGDLGLNSVYCYKKQSTPGPRKPATMPMGDFVEETQSATTAPTP